MLDMTRRDPHSAAPGGAANRPQDEGEGAQNDDLVSHLDDMENPAAFDTLLSSRAESLQALDTTPTTDIGRLRRLQILFAHDPDYPMERIEAEALTLVDVPIRSLLLMIQSEQQLYEDVVNAEADPRDTSPLELEDASKTHAMVGLAALNLGRSQLALEHFRVAIALARALGTNTRLHAITADWHRARIGVGDPDPDGLEILMAQTMPPMHRQRTQRVRSQALAEVGAYEESLRALGSPEQDMPVDAAHREFMHAMLGLPMARKPEDPLLQTQEPYLRLAYAYRQALTGKVGKLDLSGIRGDPYVGYARLVEARHFLNNEKTIGSAMNVLGPVPPRTPAQAIGWAAIRATDALEAGQGITALQALDVLRANIDRVRHRGMLTRAVYRTSPELLLLILLGPFGHRISGLSDLSILVGQTIIHEGNWTKLPGRTGRAAVLQAAHHPEMPEISRSERKRLNEALAGFGQVVNAGGALRYALAIYRAAVGTGDTAVIAAWASAYEQIYGMLSADVQTTFAAHPGNSLL